MMTTPKKEVLSSDDDEQQLLSFEANLNTVFVNDDESSFECSVKKENKSNSGTLSDTGSDNGAAPDAVASKFVCRLNKLGKRYTNKRELRKKANGVAKKARIDPESQGNTDSSSDKESCGEAEDESNDEAISASSGSNADDDEEEPNSDASSDEEKSGSDDSEDKDSCSDDSEEEEEDRKVWPPLHKKKQDNGWRSVPQSVVDAANKAEFDKNSKKMNLELERVLKVSAALGDLVESKTTGPSAEKTPGDSDESASETQDHVKQGGFRGKLKDYQVQGVEWLNRLFLNGFSGILADEMGLGKTVQTIAFLCYLRANKFWAPIMIIGPKSTLLNWKAEFKRFAPKIPTVVYRGSQKQRIELAKNLRKYPNDFNFPVIITSYTSILQDFKYFRPPLMPKLKLMVVDEGHRLKNPECRLLESLCNLKPETKLLLTGTPLQNNLIELWSLLNFVLPDMYKSREDFLSWFELEIKNDKLDKDVILTRERKDKMVSHIRSALKPLILRRTKTQVNIKLPPKRELLVFVPMTREQLVLTDAIIAKKYEEVMRGLFEHHKVPVPTRFPLPDCMRNKLMSVRMLAQHPYLLPHPLFFEKESDKFMEFLPKLSGKMQLISMLLPRIVKIHKVLLFSQFTEMLNIYESYLDSVDIEYTRLDGSKTDEMRDQAISQFQNDERTRVFLLSTRAGGLGINLTKATVVILADADWNPQCDLQAQARAHRIGQKSPVTVIRLFSYDSVEMRMLERGNSRRILERAVIAHGGFAGKIAAASKKIDDEIAAELETLLDGSGLDAIDAIIDASEKVTAKSVDEIIANMAKEE